MTKEPKICFITAIYGGFEINCKKYVEQTVDTDFICFTDNKNIVANGWIIDTTPYHMINKNDIDDGTYVNSLCNNTHTFNVAKYYKQSFRKIPILQKYDVVVWIDGTIEIIYDGTSEYILDNIYSHKIISWHHENREGFLSKEVRDSHFIKYTSTFWHNQKQPYQDIDNQYKTYLENGYRDSYFKDMDSHTKHMGVWITCFVAFLFKDEVVENFLDMWYLQTLKYTTQDQIGFPYVCQMTRLTPYTLPDHEIYGYYAHIQTKFYTKHLHGM